MRIHSITQAERALFGHLSYGERLRAFIRRQRPIHDIYASDKPYLPPHRLKGEGANAYLEPLDIIITDGAQVSNTVSETIICPDFSIPGFYMAPYKTIDLWAYGVCSNVVTTPGTLTMRVRWGGVAGTLLLATAAQGMDTTAHTNALWMLEAKIVCRSAGAAGSFMSGGIFGQFNLLPATAANLLPALMGSAGAPGASGNAAVAVDTTTQKLLSLTAQFSVATSPTNLTCQQRIIIVNN